MAGVDDDTLTNHGQASPVTIRSPATRYGRYRLGAVLGRGGMGEVVSADDDAIGRTVAIKRLRGDTTEAAIARFEREARIQGQLEHPAIVPVHELGRDESGRPVIVMKQLRGTTLYDVLRGTHSRPKLLRAFVDICLAVEFAHARGIVHRDLKPSNVSLGDFGEVYVLDWGIARVSAETSDAVRPVVVEAGATVAGTILGTPGYMPPEQLRGDADLDGRADVYALGCILFEILAGERLDADASLEPSRRAGTADAEPSRRPPERDVPPELDAACRKATMPDRDARHASARELAAVVEGVLDGDRDVAQRKKLAAELLAEARAAMARGDRAAERAAAIAAAGRALALDPTSHDIAALVGRLMIEPPAETPPEVERELEAGDVRAFAANNRDAQLTVAGYAAFIPVMWWSGLHAWWIYAGFCACGLVVAFARRRVLDASGVRRPYATMWTIAAIGTPVIVSFTQSPLSALPTALVVAARLASYRTVVSTWTLIGAIIAAVLVPWVLAPETLSVDGAVIGIHPIADALDHFGLLVWLVLAAAIPVATIVLNNRATLERDLANRRTIHLQAWQLRQLLPR
jgi:serine/threonine-protein kinase